MPRRSVPRYVELHAASAFSFLDGSSAPEEIIERAAELEIPAIALTDRNGVYGSPRAHKAAVQTGIRAIVGAEVVVEDLPDGFPGETESPKKKKKKQTRLDASREAAASARLTLLVRHRGGYKNLCKLLTAAARGRPKGAARATWAQIRAHADGLHCLTGGAEGPLRRRLLAGRRDAAAACLADLREIFGEHLHVELQRHRLRQEEHLNQALAALAQRKHVPIVATGGVRHARASEKPLYDVLTAIRHHTRLDAAGRLLEENRERHLRDAREMYELFADLPHAVHETVEIADRLSFTLDDLGYRFPDYPLPPGETPSSFLREITWNAARARFRPFTAKAQRQIEKELNVIEKLDLAGYFLIVWDIIRFCKREGILAQGRGSAANSAVCYALSITAVDPVRMELLFERFLSEERGEWPDIDLDLPSGDQREKVLQYVYQRYGPHGAGMTANVITYRDRLAAREVGKALGFSENQIGRLSKELSRLRYDVERGDARNVPEAVRAAGCDPTERRMKLFLKLWRQFQHLPRHLGQHSGGMIVAAGRLDEVVPLEPASMPGRTVVQWDKEDCADLGIIKIDLLGLGMLNAIEEAVPLIRQHDNPRFDLAHLPADDPKVYEMLRRADTVGVFQVESRAQMASLPRNAPRRFYDLVIQVAIIRPGPITGGMVHPFFERRQGREPVTYAHPSLEPILKRTLGVPIFQEQLLRIAMVAAGFTGGEAEELRRAMGFKRSMDRMAEIEKRLRAGMTANGIGKPAQEQIVKSITAFGLYGFPESHAASFALIAYASAFIKAYHPTIFYLCLLNAWPMGFYHPSSLIQDAKRQGVSVLPIDVSRSDVRCTRENERAFRLGLRFLQGVRRRALVRIETERRRRPFDDLDDFIRRCDLREGEIEQLAFAGALRALGENPQGMNRREALWQASRLAKPAGPLLEDQPAPERAPPLPNMLPIEETLADFEATGLTTGAHPMAYARKELKSLGVKTVHELESLPPGLLVRFAGAVIVRQRPGTAKGMLFVTLEDETGMAQAVISPDLMEENRRLISESAGLIIEGILERRDGSMSVRAQKFEPIRRLATAPSHDWH